MTDLSTWAGATPPARTVLDGRYVRLEPLDPAVHEADLYAASTAPGMEDRFRYLFESPPEDRPAFRRWMEGAATGQDRLTFAVVDKATGRAEGRQSLMRIDAAHGVIEAGGILWGPAIARSRAATEALFLFAAHVFDDLGYRRFEWKCDSRNAPSRRAAERFGFVFEGVFRDHMVIKGCSRDTAWFAMTRADWAAIRPAYDAWLAPENFDGAGVQKTGLDVRR